MRAYVQRRYGPPGHLELAEVDEPSPGPGEVLVRVEGTSVNPYDWHHLRGEPLVARIMPGGPALRRPFHPVLGCDLAGRVTALGDGVTDLEPGDAVYALVPQGGFAEYACVPRERLARQPATLTSAQSGVVPMAAVTALLAARCVKPGMSVLVNGASGGVGTFAVQIATSFGGTVTAVCGQRNADLMTRLGAAAVVDYRSQDITRSAARYDVLIDVAGGRPARRLRHLVAPTGVFVVVGGQPGRWVEPAGHAFSALALGPFVPQRVELADAVNCRAESALLEELSKLISDGSVQPVVERTYAFEDLPEAVAYQEQGHATGKVAVSVTTS